jgi:hypothetical protein
MPTLEAIHSQNEKGIDKFLSQFDSEMEKVFTKVQAIASTALAGLSKNDVLQYEFVWREALKEAGYYKLVNKLIDDNFNSLHKGTVQAFEAGGLKAIFTAEDAVSIQAMKSMRRNFFMRLGDDVGLAVKKSLYGHVLADSTLVEMSASIATTLKDSNLAKHATTYARTAAAEFQQETIFMKASEFGDDGDVWVYVGVSDKKTRDFCQDVLDKNKAMTKKEALKVRGDKHRQFNCRHKLFNVSRDYAESSGYAV